MDIDGQSSLESLLSGSTGLVVVEFYAASTKTTWTIDDLAAQFKHVTFAKVNIDVVEDLAKKNKELIETVLGDEMSVVTAVINKHAPPPQDDSTNTEGDSKNTSEKAKEVEDAKPIEPLLLSVKALECMWKSDAVANSNPLSMPPPSQLNRALAQLRVTLLPQNQHKSVICADGVQPFEPTLVLYCPLEGGEHIIDTTVKEIAQDTGSEVQVIDMAHVAAGKWGDIGYGFQIAKNPLGNMEISASLKTEDESRALKTFWTSLINSNPPNISETPVGSESPGVRPRIVYLRDFGLLGSSASAWYPTLRSAVCERRSAGTAPEKSVSNPTTIIIGISPALFSTNQDSKEAEDPFSSYIAHILGNSTEPPKAADWSEGACEARAKRLKTLNEKWEKGTLLDDLPPLSTESPKAEGEESPQPSSKPDDYFRSCIIAPAIRNVKLERAARQKRRRELNQLMVRMCIGANGGTLEPSSPIFGEEDCALSKDWGERVLSLSSMQDVADRALGDTTSSEHSIVQTQQTATVVTLKTLQDAWRAQSNDEKERKSWTKLRDETNDDEEVKEDEDRAIDEVVEKVKAMDLDENEQRLLGCIVDTVNIPTTFDSVHLPMETIDSIRSIVSLPLLFPQAFKSGILKQQAMSGALLFGPPGTGKTLVARALAKESGARMLAIKPSDIQDKYVGETEKLVKSLFKLARRLKPCVVFIDEIDAIMGSRTKASSCSARWHSSMLTEFMQEMDGLIASSVMVIGATNRPFDIDDAVLRRLPCRLFIDLPGEPARQEIIKIMLRGEDLAPDVDISALAKTTERFSGSDLKHLCVAAAMDSLKEGVKLPWETSQSLTTSTTRGLQNHEVTSHSKLPLDDIVSSSSSSSDHSSDMTGSPPASNTSVEDASKPNSIKIRTLAARHFTRALMEVTPSSSETQGSLSELRKWNTQYGTGARNRLQKVPGVSPAYNYGSHRYNGSTAAGLGFNVYSNHGTNIPDSPFSAAGFQSSTASGGYQSIGSGGVTGVGDS